MSEVFYTSVNRFRNDILVRGYKDGKPFKTKVPYKPTLYVPTREPSSFQTIDGRYVDSIQPGSMGDCTEFIKKYKDIDNFQVYGSTNYVYQFINEKFKGEVKFNRDVINVTTVDIEVQSDQGFPHPKDALFPITAITMKNNIDDIYYVFGCGEYSVEDSIVENAHIKYIECRDEKELLIKFIDQWASNYPDIMTGWNSRLFDTPYIVNRTIRILGDKAAKRLSPWGLINSTEIVIAGNSNQAWELTGVQQLDYLDLFKKFGYTYGTQESYRLDNIGHVVLGEKKLDYSEYGSLHELYRLDYQKFIDYNVKDVQLVDRMEDKLGLITLCLTVAYRGKVNYSESFGTVGVWDAILHNYLLERGYVVPPKVEAFKDGQIEGGHVKDPQVGLHDWVVSFDLNSLYPHIMMQYNMSPETVMNDQVYGVDVEKCLNKQEFEFDKSCCMTARGNLFTNERKGFIATIVEEMYNERSAIKKKMLGAEQELVNIDKKDKKAVYAVEREIAQFGNQQMAIKILMNSLYGATSNNYFRYFDVRVAESITMTGQLTIRWAEKKINAFMNKVLKTENVDYVIAIDTDSLYISMGALVNQINPKDPVKFLDKVCKEKLEPLLDAAYEELREYMNCSDQKMVMKRETIAEKGIWTGKKHYVLSVWNNEGVQYNEPKLKIQGIEAVRSSTPAPCRNLIKDTVAKILRTDEGTVQKFIQESKEYFKTLPPEDIAFPRSANNLDKYVDASNIYRKGTPIHVRGTLLYNYHVDRLNVQMKYEKIYSGEKIKFLYLRKPNRIYENVIAFKDILPEEFNIRDSVDYDLQFEKAFVEPIRTIMDAIGWQVEKRATLEDFFG